MNEPNYLQKVVLEIDLGNGDVHKYVADRPGVFGGNPSYMMQQLAAALADLRQRAEDMLKTYAPQIVVCSRPPGIVEDPCVHCNQPKAAHAAAWSA